MTDAGCPLKSPPHILRRMKQDLFTAETLEVGEGPSHQAVDASQPRRRNPRNHFLPESERATEGGGKLRGGENRPSTPPKTWVFQARKKSTKIKFLGPETARWGGGLPREGVVAENFVPALETLSSLGFEERNPGCPGNFAGMSRTPGGVQKVCAKKLRVHFSFPAKVWLDLTNIL